MDRIKTTSIVYTSSPIEEQRQLSQAEKELKSLQNLQSYFLKSFQQMETKLAKIESKQVRR